MNICIAYTHFHRSSCCLPYNLWAASWATGASPNVPVLPGQRHCLRRVLNYTDLKSQGNTMSRHSQSLWQWLGLFPANTALLLNGDFPSPHTAPSLGLVIRNPRSCSCGQTLIPSLLLTSTSNQIPNQFQSSEHTIVQVEQEAAHIFVIHFPSSVCFILRNDLKGRRCRKKLFTPVRTRESQQTEFRSLFKGSQ